MIFNRWLRPQVHVKVATIDGGTVWEGRLSGFISRVGAQIVVAGRALEAGVNWLGDGYFYLSTTGVLGS